MLSVKGRFSVEHSGRSQGGCSRCPLVSRDDFLHVQSEVLPGGWTSSKEAYKILVTLTKSSEALRFLSYVVAKSAISQSYQPDPGIQMPRVVFFCMAGLPDTLSTHFTTTRHEGAQSHRDSLRVVTRVDSA